jgi:hypothetical protein
VKEGRGLSRVVTRAQGHGRYSEAIPSYRRSITLSDAILAGRPTDTTVLPGSWRRAVGMATAMPMAGD